VIVGRFRFCRVGTRVVHEVPDGESDLEFVLVERALIAAVKSTLTRAGTPSPKPLFEPK
jgi:hypothetical protein